MTRPVGVTVIAIINVLGVAWSVQYAVRLIARDGLMTSIVSENYRDTELVASFILTMITFPTLYMLASWGLWKLKNWGRILTIALTAQAVAFECIRWFLTRHLTISNYVVITLALVLHGAIALYLLKPDVRAVFSLALSRTASGMA